MEMLTRSSNFYLISLVTNSGGSENIFLELSDERVDLLQDIEKIFFDATKISQFFVRKLTENEITTKLFNRITAILTFR